MTKYGRALQIAGIILPFAFWFILSYVVNVPTRILPTPQAVLKAFVDIEPSIWFHGAVTSARLFIGFSISVVAGIVIGLSMYKSRVFSSLSLPFVQSIRSIPPVATIPFFLLWFGFSEWGRVILIVCGISLNLAIATYEILIHTPEKFRVLFCSYGQSESDIIVSYCLPRVLEALLPTVRFSLSTAIGLIVVSELLGSQMGLGYLIQTSRSTFSMHVVFSAAILLGVMNLILDFMVVRIWTFAVYWRR